MPEKCAISASTNRLSWLRTSSFSSTSVCGRPRQRAAAHVPRRGGAAAKTAWCAAWARGGAWRGARRNGPALRRFGGATHHQPRGRAASRLLLEREGGPEALRLLQHWRQRPCGFRPGVAAHSGQAAPPQARGAGNAATWCARRRGLGRGREIAAEAGPRCLPVQHASVAVASVRLAVVRASGSSLPHCSDEISRQQTGVCGASQLRGQAAPSC